MKQKIQLKTEEVARLQTFTHTGVAPARELTRAKVLLASNEGIKDKNICAVEHVTRPTCYNIRKRFADGGIEKALHDAPRPGAEKILTIEEEAEIIATYCSDPPDGSSKWTMELLTEDFNKKHDKHVSKNTVWRVTLRSPEKPWRKKNVVYPQGYRGIFAPHV
jgi:transposase